MFGNLNQSVQEIEICKIQWKSSCFPGFNTKHRTPYIRILEAFNKHGALSYSARVILVFVWVVSRRISDYLPSLRSLSQKLFQAK